MGNKKQKQKRKRNMRISSVMRYPRRDSNPQSSASETDALSIRPRGLSFFCQGANIEAVRAERPMLYGRRRPQIQNGRKLVESAKNNKKKKENSGGEDLDLSRTRTCNHANYHPQGHLSVLFPHSHPMQRKWGMRIPMSFEFKHLNSSRRCKCQIVSKVN